MRKLFLLVVILTCCSSYAYALEIGGNITEDTTWSLTDSPYYVTSTVQVLEGVKLTIEPGVIIKFNEDTGLNIGGELVARGTEDDMIVFTANQTDLPDEATQLWEGIKFVGTATDGQVDNDGNYVSGSIVEYAMISFADSALTIKSCSPVIINNTLTKNASAAPGGGIFLDYCGSIIIKNNQISQNTASWGAGIYIRTTSDIAIRYNSISNNYARLEGGGIYIGYSLSTTTNLNTIHDNTSGYHGSDNVYNNMSTNIDFTENYWGTTITSEIDDGIYDYYDDIDKGKVLYDPILTEEPQTSTNDEDDSDTSDTTFQVTTSPATNLTATTATLNAQITPNSTTTYYFEYGLHSRSPFSYRYDWQTTVETIEASSTEVSVSAVASGLNVDDDYFYRVVATNDQGTVYGERVSFKTTNEDDTTDDTTAKCSIKPKSFTVTGVQEVGEAVTFTVDAYTDSTNTLYYRFSYHPDYGTEGYDGLHWKSMTDTEWVTDNSIDYKFDTAGKYIVVVWISTETTDVDPSGIPILGWSVEIDELGEEPYFPF